MDKRLPWVDSSYKMSIAACPYIKQGVWEKYNERGLKQGLTTNFGTYFFTNLLGEG